MFPGNDGHLSDVCMAYTVPQPALAPLSEVGGSTTGLACFAAVITVRDVHGGLHRAPACL